MSESNSFSNLRTATEDSTPNQPNQPDQQNKKVYNENRRLWNQQMKYRRGESINLPPNDFALDIANQKLLLNNGLYFEIGPGDSFRDAICIAEAYEIGSRPTILGADITPEAVRYIIQDLKPTLQEKGIKAEAIKAGA